MKLVRQSNPTTCGQACVAMILDVPLEEAIRLVGHDGITTWRDLFIGVYGESEMGHSGNVGKPPQDKVCFCEHFEPDGNRRHWTVWNKGEVLDPACIGKKLWPIGRYYVV